MNYFNKLVSFRIKKVGILFIVIIIYFYDISELLLHIGFHEWYISPCTSGNSLSNRQQGHEGHGLIWYDEVPPYLLTGESYYQVIPKDVRFKNTMYPSCISLWSS